METRINLSGVQGVNNKIQQFISTLPAQIEDGLKTTLDPVMAESQSEVPVDTAALKESKFITVNKESNKITAEIGYSDEQHAKINPKTGQKTDTYAVRVHEDLDMRHVVGKAKFLEDPVMRNTDNILRKVTDTVKTAINKL